MKRLMTLLLATVLVALVSPAVSSADPPGRPRGILEPSVILRNRQDYQQGLKRLAKAHELGCKHINFVVTMNCEVVPDEDDARVLRYGLASHVGRRWSLEPLTDDLLKEMVGYYKQLVRKAVEYDMAIAVLCHLDIGAQRYVWRNYFRFDPMEQLDGYSYQTGLIEPLLQVLSEETPIGHTIDLSIAGEMGTSVFAHPGKWHQLIGQTQRTLHDKNVQAGISFNHNGIEGKHVPTEPQQKLMNRLLADCDFVGFSNYGQISRQPTVDDFTNNVTTFANAFDRLSIRLPDDTVLHFSEIGLGGCGPSGPTDDLDEVRTHLWEGTSRHWRNPWTDETRKQFRLSYHRSLLTFLAKQPAQWPVEAAFFWSEGSWDPQGIDGPYFANDEIRDMIRRHNVSVRQAPTLSR